MADGNRTSSGAVLSIVSSFWDLPQNGSYYYTIEGILSLFYLIHPKRTMFKNLEDTPNFFAMGVRHFPLLIVLEYALLRLQRLPVYKWNDSLVGLCTFIISVVPQLFIERVAFVVCQWLNTTWKLVDLPHDSVITWLACLLAVDFSFYISHRLTHEVNVLWAFHQLHHSSEYYNQFSIARNSFVDKLIGTVFVLPWSLLLPTAQLKVHYQLNLLYQFWIHTRTIGHLGFLEKIFVTPTQHELHHGRNRFCIDVNYGGFLSIWDQLFKTMVWPERHRADQIYFGLVFPVRSWDLVYLYCQDLRRVYRKVMRMDSMIDRLSAVLKGPGWRPKPGYPRLGYIDDLPQNVIKPIPYDKDSANSIYFYCAVNVAIAWCVNESIVQKMEFLPMSITAVTVVYNVWSLCNVCYILEHKSIARHLEFLRSIIFTIYWLFLTDAIPTLSHVLSGAIAVCSVLSFIFWGFNKPH